MRHKQKNKYKQKTFADLIDNEKVLGFIDYKNKKFMIEKLRKIILDCNKMELYCAQLDFTKEQNIIFRQLLGNIKRRAQSTLWALTGTDFSTVEKIESLKDEKIEV